LEKLSNMPEKKKTTTKKTVKKVVPKKPAAKSSKKPVKKELPKTKEPKAVVEVVEIVEEAKKKVEKPASGRYIKSIGRRKRSIALVRMYKNGKGGIIVNEKDYRVYFPVLTYQKSIEAPLEATGNRESFDFTVKAMGGGVRGQADAVMLGIARALVILDPELKKSLKKPGYLTRDPRKKERKKPGLKGARRAPQWSKR
jgi:small subunit ribosomal protein S9